MVVLGKTICLNRDKELLLHMFKAGPLCVQEDVQGVILEREAGRRGTEDQTDEQVAYLSSNVKMLSREILVGADNAETRRRCEICP